MNKQRVPINKKQLPLGKINKLIIVSIGFAVLGSLVLCKIIALTTPPLNNESTEVLSHLRFIMWLLLLSESSMVILILSPIVWKR